MEISAVEKNPWDKDSTCLTSLRHAISVAQRTGHLRWDTNQSEQEEIVSTAQNSVVSLKFIELLKDVERRRNQLEDMMLQIQFRIQDKETSDLTHVDTLERKITEISDLNAHLQNIVSHKDQLISRLQQPYVGDFLKIEAQYKGHVAEAFPMLVPVLSNLKCHLENIDWLSKQNLVDGQLEAVLTDISTNLASLQTGFQNLCNLRETVSSLHNQRGMHSK